MTKYCIKITLIVFLAFFLFPQAVYAAFFDGLICGEKQVLQLSGFLYLFVQIAQWILGITGSLALLMFVIGGFIWLVSRGQQKWIEMGRATLINAVIGLLIVFGSWFLIDLVLKTVAPGVYKGGRWYEFSNDICKDARTKGLAQPAIAPPSPPTRTERAIGAHSQDLAIKCIDEKTAQAACEQCRKRNGLPSIVKTDTAGVACPSGQARCECQDKKTGLKCDANYPRPSYTACTCGQGKIVLSSKADSANVPLKDKDGKPYFCCNCVEKKFFVKDINCGKPANTIDNLKISYNQNPHKVCEIIKPGSTLKRCETEGAAVVTISGKEYCLWGGEGSVCAVTWGEGVESGCATQDIKCVHARDLEIFADECSWDPRTWVGCGGNAARAVVRMPAGWAKDKVTELAGYTSLGVCVARQ